MQIEAVWKLNIFRWFILSCRIKVKTVNDCEWMIFKHRSRALGWLTVLLIQGETGVVLLVLCEEIFVDNKRCSMKSSKGVNNLVFANGMFLNLSLWCAFEMFAYRTLVSSRTSSLQNAVCYLNMPSWVCGVFVCTSERHSFRMISTYRLKGLWAMHFQVLVSCMEKE